MIKKLIEDAKTKRLYKENEEEFELTRQVIYEDLNPKVENGNILGNSFTEKHIPPQMVMEYKVLDELHESMWQLRNILKVIYFLNEIKYLYEGYFKKGFVKIIQYYPDYREDDEHSRFGFYLFDRFFCTEDNNWRFYTYLRNDKFKIIDYDHLKMLREKTKERYRDSYKHYVLKDIDMLRGVSADDLNKDIGYESPSSAYFKEFDTASDITKEIFTKGDCGRFALILKRLYSCAEIFYDEEESHYITKIAYDYFDINGCVTEKYKDKKKLQYQQVNHVLNGDCYCNYNFNKRGPMI